MSSPSQAPADWAAVRALFDAALALPAAQRRAHVEAAEASPAVRAEVLSLLAAFDTQASDDFLETRPAWPSTTASTTASTFGRPFGATTVARNSGHDGLTQALDGGFARTQAATTATAFTPPADWAAPDDALPPGTRLGPWEVLAPLGAGGMAEVMLARRADGAWQGEAAVKLIRRGMDSQAVLARFALEQQALARLNHPHIARLLDAGRTPEGLPYFVMECVRGQPLDEACREQPLEQRLHWFLQLADAVAFAHRQLLLHRDLKPSNVMVDAQRQVKLLDFGIAKALDPLENASGADTTVAGQRPFTPFYASPEQVRGEPVGTATDIYSLGVLLYVILTGRRPYGREVRSAQQVLRSVLEEAPTRPSSLPPPPGSDVLGWETLRRRLRGDLDNILLKALEKPPERRYLSVEALAADVRAFLGGFPVSARAPSTTYLLSRFVARNRRAVAAVGVGALAALGGVSVALWQGQQAALARDQAQQQLAGVKRMATELVFRYGDALANLPGGARAQETVLQETLASLDMALANAPDDPDLSVLVASVLGRLAQLQGNPTFAGPERAAQAEATVARALALGERVWASHHRDWRFAIQHLVALMTRAQLLRGRNQPAQGLAVLAQAAERAQQVLATPGLSALGRASVLELRANIWVNTAHFHDHGGRPSLGQPQQALAYYERAEADFRQLYGNASLLAELERNAPATEAPASQWGRHNLANVHAGRALVHQRLLDDAAMLRDIQAAITLRRANVADNPQHLTWRQALMFDLDTLAAAQLRLGDGAAALAAAQEAWAMVEALLRQADPGNPWHTTRASLAPQYGRALASQGRHAEALPVFELGEKGLAEAVQANPQARVLGQRLAWMQVLRARSLLALGRAEAAAQLAQTAVQSLLTLEAQRDLPPALLRDVQRAQAEGREVLALAAGRGAGSAAKALKALAAPLAGRPP